MLGDGYEVRSPKEPLRWPLDAPEGSATGWGSRVESRHQSRHRRCRTCSCRRAAVVEEGRSARRNSSVNLTRCAVTTKHDAEFFDPQESSGHRVGHYARDDKRKKLRNRR